MKPPPRPIRFLVAVVGCWVGVRAFLLWPGEDGGGQPPQAGGPTALGASAASAPHVPWVAEQHASARAPRPEPAWQSALGWAAPMLLTAPAALKAPLFPPPLALAARPTRLDTPFPAVTGVQASPAAAPGYPLLTYPPLPPASAPRGPHAAPGSPGRWSGFAWLFVREDAGGGGLAPGGTLGGSQAGARLAYRVNADARRPLAISGRLYVPLERPRGAEVALGVDWQPIAPLPLHILAERRQRIGREGRSDFAVTIYGGAERRLLRDRLRIEAYGQAGIVGLTDRDLFADGSVRVSTPIGPAEIGAGAWGGAQPGAARVDVGPQATFRIPVGKTAIRASAEWRFRVAGDAQPGSGPALTLATDF